MPVFILTFLLGRIPAIALFLWLRNRRPEDTLYRDTCNRALLRGLLATFPIILLSGVLSVMGAVSGLKAANPLLYQAYYKFIVLACAEELVKYWMLRGLLKKSEYRCSWLDLICFMTIIGLGFGLSEDLAYVLDGSIGTLVIRGITVAHGGYGFLMGYFLGKGRKTGKKGYSAIGFLLPWFLHGLYDFSLSKELIEISENFMFLGLGLAFLDLVVAVGMVLFFRKARTKEVYLEPLPVEHA